MLAAGPISCVARRYQTASAALLVLALLLGGAARAAPPCGADVGPLFERLRLGQLGRLRARFTEEKHLDLLARPLKSEGTIYFDRKLGIARVGRSERVVLGPATLRVERDGRVEEVALARSRPLKAFVLVFPSLLRGERAPLEGAFALELCGGGAGDEGWVLSLRPKDPALAEVITRVSVSGHGREVDGLEVSEKSGDLTTTRFADVLRDDAVPADEIARAFR